MENISASDAWLTVIRMTDDMRRYAELQQWDDVSSLAVQRQAQLQVFFSRQSDMTTEQRDEIVSNVQQLMAADKLLINAASEIKNAMAEGLTQINQGRKAVLHYQNCADTK
jgi:hypothetical protein